MKYILRAVTAAAAFIATLAVVMLVRESVPDGHYCGRYASNLVVGNMSMNYREGSFNVTVKGLGMDLDCKNEKFMYNLKTHTLSVPGIKDPNDCIGSVMKSSGLTLYVTYDPSADIVVLDFGFAKILCKKCAAMSYFRGVF